jgi:hypothetical protein
LSFFIFLFIQTIDFGLQARNHLFQRVYFFSVGAHIGLQFDLPLVGLKGLFAFLFIRLTKALNGFLKDDVCFLDKFFLDSLGSLQFGIQRWVTSLVCRDHF